MLVSRLIRRPLLAATVLAVSLAIAAPSLATEHRTCEDDGYATWVFASGVLTFQGPDEHQLCRQAWNDFAHRFSSSGFFQPIEGSTWVMGQTLRTYSCVTCGGRIADTVPSVPTLSYDVSGAGDIATSFMPGTVVKIERHDRFEDSERSVYTVDVMGEHGKSQVLVDGMTGEAEVVKASAEPAGER